MWAFQPQHELCWMKVDIDRLNEQNSDSGTVADLRHPSVGLKLWKTSMDTSWIVWVKSKCPQERAYSLRGQCKIGLLIDSISDAVYNCIPNLWCLPKAASCGISQGVWPLHLLQTGFWTPSRERLTAFGLCSGFLISCNLQQWTDNLTLLPHLPSSAHIIVR